MPTQQARRHDANTALAAVRAAPARALSILGTRGIPARHGGFETFAERLALHLAAKGWRVTVYCQRPAGDGQPSETRWRGVRLVGIPVAGKGAVGSVVFDFLAALRALHDPGELLTLGYNTALFGALFRLRGRRNVINMDGIEWRRAKWSAPVKLWFYLNERIACLLGDGLIADHPEIEAHLATRTAASRIAMVPYGADEIEHADASALERFGVRANAFALLIARPEPENSVLELVRAFSARKRALRLVVLGRYDAAASAYQRRVLAAASDQVSFAGAVYDGAALAALRLHCRFYLHGHQVGGTNPSLVEALGAGCAVLAHDNAFNRWVAGQGARFFRDEAQCESQIDLLAERDSVVAALRSASRARFRQAFLWEPILSKYEHLLQPRPAHAAGSVPSPASLQT